MEVSNKVTGEVRQTPFIDDQGREVLDTTPLSLPVGFKRPETLAEQVARLVRRQHYLNSLEIIGEESFEEAEDFDISDDPVDPDTPYQSDDDLAAVQAVNHGLVRPPSEDELTRARDIIQRAKDAIKKRSSKKSSEGDGASQSSKEPSDD